MKSLLKVRMGGGRTDLGKGVFTIFGEENHCIPSLLNASEERDTASETSQVRAGHGNGIQPSSKKKGGGLIQILDVG